MMTYIITKVQLVTGSASLVRQLNYTIWSNLNEKLDLLWHCSAFTWLYVRSDSRWRREHTSASEELEVLTFRTFVILVILEWQYATCSEINWSELLRLVWGWTWDRRTIYDFMVLGNVIFFWFKHWICWWHEIPIKWMLVWWWPWSYLYNFIPFPVLMHEWYEIACSYEWHDDALTIVMPSKNARKILHRK